MTSDELQALIEGDPEAKAFADAGNDTACAARCSAIAPKVVGGERLVNKLSIIGAFADPAAGYAAIAKLEAAAGSNPVLALALEFMGPTAPRGVDVAHASTRAMLDALGASNVLTSDEVATIKSMGEVAQSVSANDVAAALRGGN